MKENRDSLFVVTDTNISIAVGMFIGVYPIVAGFSLPQAVIFTLPGESLFSALLSPLFLNIGTTVGATIALSAARHLLRGAVE